MYSAESSLRLRQVIGSVRWDDRRHEWLHAPRAGTVGPVQDPLPKKRSDVLSPFAAPICGDCGPHDEKAGDSQTQTHTTASQSIMGNVGPKILATACICLNDAVDMSNCQ